jgi:hypothetical protein
MIRTFYNPTTGVIVQNSVEFPNVFHNVDAEDYPVLIMDLERLGFIEVGAGVL